MIRTANAPVSYGVFALSRPDRVPLPSGPELLGLVSDAGYDGVDLGPHGYFGTGHALAENLAAHELALCGGWLDLPFSGSDEVYEAAEAAILPVLDDFALCARQQGTMAPKPTIADSGSAERSARPGGGVDLELPRDRWDIFAGRVQRVVNLVADRGLIATFHHHACTYVETPREIERLLTDTTIGLTLDTGHLLLGGGDPMAALADWGPRINHLHVKDVRTALLHAASGSDNPVRDLWEKRVFVPLGDGDLDIEGFLDAVLARGFEGWLVVEQDVVLLDGADVRRAIDDQVANREALRRWVP